MPKVGLIHKDDILNQRWFYCPGCERDHRVKISGPHAWAYNGKPDAPTFTPSVLVQYNGKDAGIDGAPPAICHSFVTDGNIQFLSDCTHALAGQTVALPDWETEILVG